ncbi:hypothetical protein BB560_004389 [Smittium megazygosporum]|uniref:Uncharacterized protein n=1 Tax=Smittium megazygosporum TaxID=133381 RepID=A0A2T9Z9I2_9FUNG|nr:hypothetical protein BB560_004389 [Smittium megazygosporum]
MSQLKRILALARNRVSPASGHPSSTSPLLVFQSRAEKYLKIAKFGSIYTSAITSSLTAVFSYGAKFDIPIVVSTISELNIPIASLAFAALASLSSSAFLILGMRSYVVKVLLERTSIPEHDSNQSKDSPDLDQNDSSKSMNNPHSSSENSSENKNLNTALKSQKLPSFNSVYYSKLKKLKSQDYVAPNTDFAGTSFEESEYTIKLGPYTINGVKQYILLSKNSIISLYTLSWTGLSYVQTKAALADIRINPRRGFFNNWSVILKTAESSSESDSSQKKTKREFTVLSQISSNKQERDLMSQIASIISLNDTVTDKRDNL